MVLSQALAAVIQSTVVSRIQIFGVSPDLVLLVTVTWILLAGPGAGVLAALSGGMALDLFSGAPFGVLTLALVCSSAFAILGESNLFRGLRLLPYVVIGVSTVVYYGIIFFLLQLGGRPVVWSVSLQYVVAPAAFVNTLCMPLIYGVGGYLQRRLAGSEVELG